MWYSLILGILFPLLFMLLSIRKKQNCIHDWFNMRVIDTEELARLCEKCFKLERHLEKVTTEAMPRNGE